MIPEQISDDTGAADLLDHFPAAQWMLGAGVTTPTGSSICGRKQESDPAFRTEILLNTTSGNTSVETTSRLGLGASKTGHASQHAMTGVHPPSSLPSTSPQPSCSDLSLIPILKIFILTRYVPKKIYHKKILFIILKCNYISQYNLIILLLLKLILISINISYNFEGLYHKNSPRFQIL